MIIGITGLNEDAMGNLTTIGAGKDAAANRLVEKHNFIRIGLADPLKRFCADVFAFSDEQLWGPSACRNAPDFRYPHAAQQWRDAYASELVLAEQDRSAGDLAAAAQHEKLALGYAVEGWLTPRQALQQLGTEWGRRCYNDVWIEYAMRTATRLAEGDVYYSPQLGLRACASVDGVMTPKTNVVFSDLRFFNEFKAVRDGGGKTVRIRRKQLDKTFAAGDTNGGHQSESELATLADECFDYVIENYGTLHTLALHVDRMLDTFTGRIRTYNEAQADVPPFLRSE